MNIFILSETPRECAQMHCDKHVVKMIVESAQMLSTVHRMLDGAPIKKPSKSGKRMIQYWEHSDPELENTLYKAVHINHPCTVWTRECSANYDWHYELFVCLCKEFTHRYGKIHKTETVLLDTLYNKPQNIKQTSAITPFKLAMGAAPECMDINNPVESYRKFYKTKQARFKMEWTLRDKPEWF